MALIYINVTVRNPADTARSWEGGFLVDTRAIDCVVPRPRLEAIGLNPTGQKRYETADGLAFTRDFTIGQIEVMDEIAAGRLIFGAPDAEPRLGSTVLLSAGLQIDPERQQLMKLPVVPLKRTVEPPPPRRYRSGAVG